MLKLFPLDKANHYFYGSLAAALGAIVTLGVVLWRTHAMPNTWLACMLVALGSVIAATALGLATERRQAGLNAAAWAAGKEPGHDVTMGDVIATGLGAVPVAAPWLLLTVALAWVA
jgi:hypothetical protein